MLVTALVFILFLVVYIRKYWLVYFKAGFTIPGPPALPLLGNVLSMSSDIEKLFKMLNGLHRDYGRTVRFWAGPKLVVFLTDPGDIQAVLGNRTLVNRDYFLSVPFVKIMGNGLIANRDNTWRVHRKLLTPGFHFKVLQGYIKYFSNATQRMIVSLEPNADGRDYDPLSLISQISFQSIRDTVFGTDVHWDEQNNFIEMFHLAGDLMSSSINKPWLIFDWIFKRSEVGKKLIALRSEVNRRTSRLIDMKLEEYRQYRSHGGEKKMRAFIDSLIEESERDGSVMSIQELQEELNTLLIAAVDTTATTLAFFLSLLGLYPDIQQQVIDEVATIFGDSREHPTPDELSRMVVTERCLKETMRLFPSAPWINREVNQDIPLMSGHTLPAGSIALVFANAVHRDPVNFVDPFSFWPDRWLPENSVGRHPYAFVAFGAGQRICIGQKYAYLQMKTFVSRFFLAYRVTSTSTFEELDNLAAGPAIRSIGGHPIQIHKLHP